MSINFCHIAPIEYLGYVRDHSVHLLLAHLIEENAAYRDFYTRLKINNPNVVYHMDNSAFEMFKRGLPMMPSDRLIRLGELMDVDSIVMTDYPKEHFVKTIESATSLIPAIKDAGFKTFFCPQSELGAMDDLINSFRWAIGNPDIDYIGVSILACPIAAGVDESVFANDSTRDEAYRLQRFLSRWYVFKQLEEQMLLSHDTVKRFHCLGMTEGPQEIALLAPYKNHIFSWDSSAAVWHGIHNIRFDNSPTGLQKGKCELEVDFGIESSDLTVDTHNAIMHNIKFIDALCL